jgi:DNA-binding response OmpR family regulator
MSAIAEIAARPARILIVDDEPANRELLSIVLGLAGFEVVSAAGGAEAIASAADQVPDLMLVDLMMPEMNGYEVATAMKANVLTKHIGLIMITALTDSATRVASLAAGADAFLTKPLNRAELYLCMRRLLSNPRPRAPDLIGCRSAHVRRVESPGIAEEMERPTSDHA